MRGWIVLAILWVAPHIASAQGLFLQKGTSGYGADVGIATDGRFFNVGVDAGASYRGWLDASLSVARVYMDPDDWGGERVTADVFAPGIAIHPLKQSATTPVSLALAASASFYRFNGMPLTARGSSLSGTLYRFFKLGTRYGVIPGVQVTYDYLKVRDDEGSTAESDGVTVAIGGHFAWLRDNDLIVTLTPGISFGDGPATFLLTLGALRARP